MHFLHFKFSQHWNFLILSFNIVHENEFGFKKCLPLAMISSKGACTAVGGFKQVQEAKIELFIESFMIED